MLDGGSNTERSASPFRVIPLPIRRAASYPWSNKIQLSWHGFKPQHLGLDLPLPENVAVKRAVYRLMRLDVRDRLPRYQLGQTFTHVMQYTVSDDELAATPQQAALMRGENAENFGMVRPAATSPTSPCRIRRTNLLIPTPLQDVSVSTSIYPFISPSPSGSIMPLDSLSSEHPASVPQWPTPLQGPLTGVGSRRIIFLEELERSMAEAAINLEYLQRYRADRNQRISTSDFSRTWQRRGAVVGNFLTASSSSSASPHACGGIHAAERRPYEGDCPICMEPLVESKLVFCKTGCGQSLHAFCWEKWKAEPYKPFGPLTCILCRQPWDHRLCDCDVDSIPAPVGIARAHEREAISWVGRNQ